MGGQLDVLRGVEVVEFGDDFAGAVCAYHLHLLGAATTLAEPSSGCELRRSAALFAYVGRGRRRLELTAFLAAADGVALPDVVIEPAFSPPDIAAAIRRRRAASPGTIFLSFREADGTRHTELTAQAEGGITAYLGHEAEAPLRVGFEIMSYSAGVLAVQAVIAALRVRGETGVGQDVLVPLSRVSASILSNVTAASVQPDQEAHFSRGWSHPPAGGFAAAGGPIEILFYGPAAELGWPEFCRRIGATALGRDPQFSTYAKRLDHSAALAAALAPFTGSITRDALIALVRGCNGMAMAKHSVAEAAAWEQSRANDMMVKAGSRMLPAAPWEIDGRRATAQEETER